MLQQQVCMQHRVTFKGGVVSSYLIIKNVNALTQLILYVKNMKVLWPLSMVTTMSDQVQVTDLWCEVEMSSESSMQHDELCFVVTLELIGF